MAKTKKPTVTEEQKELPVGMAFSPDKEVFKNVYFADLLQLLDTLNSLVLHIKSEGTKENNIKHYYASDLIDALDENGNVVLMQDGVTPQKTLRPDFWN